MTTAVERRTYGNWRRARGFGIGDWTTRQTAVVAGCVAIPLFALYVSVPVALGTAVVSVLVAAATLIPAGGSTLGGMVLWRLRFRQARRRGWTSYGGGVLTTHPRREDLPGPMAPMTPIESDDGRGGRQALLWDRRTGWITAVIRLAPVGLELADQDQADQWVASWGQMLADLGHQQLIRHISVTVDTAPAGGPGLADYVAARRAEQAPRTARQIMDEVVDATPAVTADVQAWMAITFDPSRAQPKPEDLLAGVAEVTRWLPGLERSLAACGVSVLGRASLGWLTARLRSAYDPAARGDLTGDERGQVLAWRDAGPVAAQEEWDHWRHDSGVSVSWGLREAPRQAVSERVWVPLLAPGRMQRRVTLLVRPYSAGESATIVEREINHQATRAALARRTGRETTQAELMDSSRAVQAAREEAQGAGVDEFTVYVTTTVSSAAELPAAVADVDQRAGQSKTRLRRLFGGQAAGFAAGLGLGVDPATMEAPGA